MFGCRRFTTSRREVQTMASHLQATAGNMSRAQQKALPTAQAIYSPAGDISHSVLSSLNGAVGSTVSLPSTCGLPAALHPPVCHQALPGIDDQPPGKVTGADAQNFVAPTSLRCQMCSTGEAAMERARSWYGQRAWARAAAVQSMPSTAAAASGAPQPAAPARACATSTDDVAASTSAVSQSQAWRFSVMCYNILADTYAQHFAHKLYGDVPRHYLDWSHRLRLLVEEIRYWSPDVVCLQEVQHYHELEPELRAAGYEGRFMRRTGRRRDGCATFWRADRLRACSTQRLDFAPLGLEDNVAMLLKLAPRWEVAAGAGMDRRTAEGLSSVRLLVATTHVTFDPAKGDVKLGQVRTLLSRAASLASNAAADDAQLVGAAAGSHPPDHTQQQQQQHSYSQHQQQHQHHACQPQFQQQQQHQRQLQHTYHHNSSSPSTVGHNGSEQCNAQQQQQQQQQQHNVVAAAVATAAGSGEPRSSPAPMMPSACGATAATAAVEGRRRKPPTSPRASSGNGEASAGGAAPAATTAAAITGAVAAAEAAGGSLGEHHAGHGLQQQQQQQQLQTLAIITGDFNSTAGSPLYQFVAQGSLDLSKTNRKKLSGQLHGVCHTQYRPVSEVKQLHAQLTAGTGTAAGMDRRDDAAAVHTPDVAATSNVARFGGDIPTPEAPIVTATGASPPETPPSTPAVAPAMVAAAAAAATASGKWPKLMTGTSGDATKPPPCITQRIATAAMDSAASAINACTTAAIAAASHPALASPVSRAVAACKVLDNFLHSAAAASGATHRLGGERWSEKELRCAMGDQYDAAAVQKLVGGSHSCAFLPDRVFESPPEATPSASTSLPTVIGAGAAADSSTQPAPAPLQQQPLPRQPRLGRHHNPPSVSRLSLGGAEDSSGGATGTNRQRRSLDLDSNQLAAPQPSSLGTSACPLVVRHPLSLKSSYMEVVRAEPMFTSIHSGFMGTVDFIWYTSDPILQQHLMPKAQAIAQPQPQPQPLAGPGVRTPQVAAAPVPRESAPVVIASPSVSHRTQDQQQPQPRTSCSQPPIWGCGVAPLTSSCNRGSAASNSSCIAADAAATGSPSPKFQLVPVAVLQPPDLELLPRGLPAAGWGSDHISIMTEFEIRPCVL